MYVVLNKGRKSEFAEQLFCNQISRNPGGGSKHLYNLRNPVPKLVKNSGSSQPLFFPSQEPQKFQVPPSKSET